MTEIIQYLPILNLLIVPVFLAYMKHEIRLTILEIHKLRVEKHRCFITAESASNGKDH
jgi:hypothetical protein